MTEIPQSPIWGIEIEALGFVHDTQGPLTYWLTDAEPGAWDTHGRVLPVLGKGLPGALSLRADFKAGGSSGGGVTFEALLKEGHDTTALLLNHFCRTRPLQAGHLQVALDETDDTVVMEAASTGLGGDVVFRGREAIHLGTEGAAGTYTGCTRGALGTGAQVHLVGEGYDTNIYSTPWPIDARYCRLFVISADAASYDNRVDLTTFHFEDGRARGPGLTLNTGGPYSLLSEQKVYPRPWTARLVSVVAPSNDLPPSRATFTPEPYPGVATALAPWGMRDTLPAVGDKLLVWWMGGVRELRYAGGGGGGIAGSRWTLDLQEPGGEQYGGEPLDIERIAQGRVEDTCRQIFVSDAAAPAASRLGGSDPTLGAALLEILTEERHGAPLPPALINADSFVTFDAELGPYAQIERLFVGVDEGALTLALIRRELASYDAALVPGPTGFELRRLRDSSPPIWTEPNLSDANARGWDEDLGKRRVVDQVEWQVDRDATGAKTPLTVTDNAGASNHKGAGRVIEVDAGSRTNPTTEYLLAYIKLGRWGEALIDVSFEAGPDHYLLPGDAITLTQEDLVDYDGASVVQGTTNSRAVISQVRRSGLTNGYLAHRMGLLYDTQRRLCPALEIKAKNSSTILVVGTDTYLVPGAGQGLYEDDRDLFVAGDICKIVDKHGADKIKMVTYAGPNGANAINVSDVSVYVWADGDRLVFEDYTSVTARQKQRHTFYGNTSGLLAGGDPAPQYEGL